MALRGEPGPVYPVAVGGLVAGGVLLGVGQTVARAMAGEPLFSDDAYYYTICARNFAETGRFTFDGGAPTHGFHPLLFWLQVVGYALLGTDASPLAQYRAVMLGQAASVLLGAGLCAGLAWRWRGDPEDARFATAMLGALAAVLLLPINPSALTSGMELAISMPLLVATAALAWRRRFAACGVAAALMVAARLDTLVYIVAPLAVSVAWSQRREPRAAIAAGAAVVVPAAVGSLLFMVWHALTFGHPVPIHGVLKSAFPAVHLQPRQLLQLGGPGGVHPPLVALLAVVAALPVLAIARSWPRLRGAALVAALLAGVQLASFVLFQKWSKPVPPWYWVLPQLCAYFALCAGLVGAAARVLRVVPLGLAALCLALPLAQLPDTARAWGRLQEQGPSPWFEPTRRFMESREPDALWAYTDAGALAFWSGRRVVNLDGLVNDLAYQRALCRGGLTSYLADRGVRYLVFGAWDRPQLHDLVYEPMYAYRVAPGVYTGDYEHAEFYVYAYLCGAYSDRIALPRDAEVWRSPPFPDGRARGRYIVFDLRRVRVR